MPAVKGLDMLLKVDSTGSGSFSTVGGIRSTEISLDGASVDVTSQDDTSRYRQLLAGAGIKTATIKGSGVFKGDSAAGTVRSYFAADTIRDWTIIVPGFYTIKGSFKITNLTYSGDHAAEVTFSISLESAGDLTFTAVT